MDGHDTGEKILHKIEFVSFLIKIISLRSLVESIILNK